MTAADWAALSAAGQAGGTAYLQGLAAQQQRRPPGHPQRSDQHRAGRSWDLEPVHPRGRRHHGGPERLPQPGLAAQRPRHRAFAGPVGTAWRLGHRGRRRAPVHPVVPDLLAKRCASGSKRSSPTRPPPRPTSRPSRRPWRPPSPPWASTATPQQIQFLAQQSPRLRVDRPADQGEHQPGHHPQRGRRLLLPLRRAVLLLHGRDAWGPP